MAEAKSYGEYDITDLVYGEYWELPLVFEDSAGLPIDISSSRFYGTFRTGKSRTETGTVVKMVFDTAANDGTCVITDGPNGQFKVVVSRTASLQFEKGVGIWDLWHIPAAPNDDKPNLLLKGKWKSDEAATDWSKVTL